jgi:hypothetical protein
MSKRHSQDFVKLERKILEVLELVRADLPEEKYQKYFDYADRHAEYEVAFVALCDWLELHEVPITQDVFNRLEEIGTMMLIENKLVWEILRPLVTDTADG